MKGRVESVSNGLATITFMGQIAATHSSENRLSRSEAKLTGRALYDLHKKSFESLLLLSNGVYRHFPPYDAPRETGGVIEWKS